MSDDFKQKPFYLKFIIFFGLAAGIMISPDNLARFGSFIGKTGPAGLFSIVFIAAFYFKFFPEMSERIYTLSKFPNNFITFFYFGTRYVLIIFLATGLLVSAGFAFNEVFLYWFPNFGFAFILLGILLCLQFIPWKFILAAQILFTAIPIFGLLIFIIFGIASEHPQTISFSMDKLSLDNFTKTGIFLLPISFFVGIDMGFSFLYTDKTKQNNQHKIIKTAILCISMIFILWGITTLYFIPLKSLAQTSIPHIIAAKKILGPLGRTFMGLMIISGTLAAVHAVFSNICIHLPGQTESGGTKKDSKKIKVILLGIVIGGLMAGGLAGSEKIDIFTKSGLILWLLSYSLVFLSNLFFKIDSTGSEKLSSKIKITAPGLLLLLSVLILISIDKNFILILKFLTVSILSIIILWIINIYRKSKTL